MSVLRWAPAAAILMVALAGNQFHSASAEGSAQATLTLRATVPAACAITLSSENALLDLNSGVTNLPVATVEERCNAANGYTVSITSKNGGSLASGTANIGYTMSYGDNSTGNGALAAERSASGAARQTTLSVSVPAASNRVAGDYEDTVTISIAAK